MIVEVWLVAAIIEVVSVVAVRNAVEPILVGPATCCPVSVAGGFIGRGASFGLLIATGAVEAGAAIRLAGFMGPLLLSIGANLRFLFASSSACHVISICSSSQES